MAKFVPKVYRPGDRLPGGGVVVQSSPVPRKGTKGSEAGATKNGYADYLQAAQRTKVVQPGSAAQAIGAKISGSGQRKKTDRDIKDQGG